MNSETPYGIIRHLNRFDTEEKCKDFLKEKVWDGRPTCPCCGNRHMNYYITTRDIYKCSSCKKQFSIIQGTMFEKSKVSLVKWFQAIFFFTTMKRGISSCQLSKMIEVHQSTAWYMLHRIREAMASGNQGQLSGFVEVDETSIKPHESRNRRLQFKIRKHTLEQERIHGLSQEKKRSKRGFPAQRGRKKGLTREDFEAKKREKELLGPRQPYGHEKFVFGMAIRGGSVILKSLGNRAGAKSKESIYPLIRKHISTSSTLMTDSYSLYQQIGTEFDAHLTVNHEKTFVDGNKYTNNIECVWFHLKKMIAGTYIHISQKHIQKYLNEHTYRWNQRLNGAKSLFENFFDMTAGVNISYNQLTSIGRENLAA